MVEIKDFPSYKIDKKGNVFSEHKQGFLRPYAKTNGYLTLHLYNNNNSKSFMVHQLMAITYLNHKPNGQTYVVDHIDGNKLNNNLNNLQIITQRENSNRRKPNPKSGYKGVYWNTVNQKWQVRLRINNKKRLLGYYNNPIKAHEDYIAFCEFIKNHFYKSESIIKDKIKEFRRLSKNYQNRYND